MARPRVLNGPMVEPLSSTVMRPTPDASLSASGERPQDADPHAPSPPAKPAWEGPDSLVARPGVLRGAAILTLQTRQAQRLVAGRAGTAGKPAIIGLLGFATRLRAIWDGARADDPYADWWLIRIDRALEEAGGALATAAAEANAALARQEGIAVTPGTSVRPVQVPLRFSTPYAYRGAQLVAALDSLVRAILTARHVGLLTRADTERAIQGAGRWARSAFASPVGYRLTGLTRADVVQNTARAEQARLRMGEVPEAVRLGTERAPHAPARPAPASTAATHRSLDPLPAEVSPVDGP